jgi:hypothetical protein
MYPAFAPISPHPQPLPQTGLLPLYPVRCPHCRTRLRRRYRRDFWSDLPGTWHSWCRRCHLKAAYEHWGAPWIGPVCRMTQ